MPFSFYLWSWCPKCHSTDCYSTDYHGTQNAILLTINLPIIMATKMPFCWLSFYWLKWHPKWYSANCHSTDNHGAENALLLNIILQIIKGPKMPLSWLSFYIMSLRPKRFFLSLACNVPCLNLTMTPPRHHRRWRSWPDVWRQSCVTRRSPGKTRSSESGRSSRKRWRHRLCQDRKLKWWKGIR
jgi:hypothetical protein